MISCNKDVDTCFERYKVISYAKRIINKEIDGAKRLLDLIDDDFIKAIRMFLNCSGKIIIMGIGKSGHVGGKLQQL